MKLYYWIQRPTEESLKSRSLDFNHYLLLQIQPQRIVSGELQSVQRGTGRETRRSRLVEESSGDVQEPISSTAGPPLHLGLPRSGTFLHSVHLWKNTSRCHKMKTSPAASPLHSLSFLKAVPTCWKPAPPSHMEINLFHVQVFSTRLENWSAGMLSIVTFKAPSIKTKVKMMRICLIYTVIV